MLPQLINQETQYLTIGQAAFSYTVEKIKGSSNLLSAKELKSQQGQEIIRKINRMREQEISAPIYSREWIQEIAIAAEEYAVGNCCEKACVAINFLLQYLNNKLDSSLTIELFNNPFTDHFFVVLGRSILTDPTDPRTWNLDTVICDIQAEKSCYALAVINFNTLLDCPYRVINDLCVDDKTQLLLMRHILSRANGKPQVSKIIPQDAMVLRFSIELPTNKSVVYNTHIPMTYEEWDLPKEKHYQKANQQISSDSTLAYQITQFYRRESAHLRNLEPLTNIEKSSSSPQ